MVMACTTPFRSEIPFSSRAVLNTKVLMDGSNIAPGKVTRSDGEVEVVFRQTWSFDAWAANRKA